MRGVRGVVQRGGGGGAASARSRAGDRLAHSADARRRVGGRRARRRCARSRGARAALVARAEWRALPAVRAGRASVVDGNAYFNRPGPRLVDSTELLARLVQPAAGGRTFDDEAVLLLGAP